jgi:TRAP-type C4-dicarboxylate transport system permease small subunit
MPDARTPEPPAVGASSALDAAVRALDRWSERASRALFRLGIYVMLPALVVLVTADVVLRYLFDSPLQWARDVSGVFLLMSIAAALPHAWDRSYHIRMEVVYDRFPARWRGAADVLSAAAGVVFFGLMAAQAAAYVPFMIRTGETGEDLLWPLWPYMAFLSVCAALTVVRLVANPTMSGADAAPPGGAPEPTASAATGEATR